MKITFLGGVQGVTGSKYLIENESTKLLVDCGLYQGKDADKKNKEPMPLDPETIDAVVLTHAHIDHTGYLPRLVKDGFKGPIYCSQATYELSSIMLIDSGFIQEERARKSDDPNKKPLYIRKDAEIALKLFKPIDYQREVKVGSLTFKLIASYHILGAAFVVVSDGKRTLTFTGDLGRPDQMIMKSPPAIKQTDYLVLESTYGDRLHSQEEPIETIGKIVSQTIARGGAVITPTFAIGRSQALLYILYQLQEQGIIPNNVPIFLDSPMATKVTDLFCQFKDEHKFSIPQCNLAFNVATDTPTTEDSKGINEVDGPAIILVGSGMAEGGRVFHHFKRLISEGKNTVLFVGYQGEGTTGRALIDGAKDVKIFGKSHPVHADVEQINMLSAHADYHEILDWLSNFENAPRKVFLTHGESESAQALKKKIEERFDWSVVIPSYLETFDLA